MEKKNISNCNFNVLQCYLQRIFPMYTAMWYIKVVANTGNCQGRPREQRSWGQYGAHLGPLGPRWAPCWPHEPCYQGMHGNAAALISAEGHKVGCTGQSTHPCGTPVIGHYQLQLWPNSRILVIIDGANDRWIQHQEMAGSGLGFLGASWSLKQSKLRNGGKLWGFLKMETGLWKSLSTLMIWQRTCKRESRLHVRCLSTVYLTSRWWWHFMGYLSALLSADQKCIIATSHVVHKIISWNDCWLGGEIRWVRKAGLFKRSGCHMGRNIMRPPTPKQGRSAFYIWLSKFSVIGWDLASTTDRKRSLLCWAASVRLGTGLY